MGCIADLKDYGSGETGLIDRLKALYTSIGGAITDIEGTANEVEVTDNGDGTFTIGLPDSVTITLDLTVGNDVNVGGDVYIEEDNRIYYDA